jgi:hypothetical protein
MRLHARTTPTRTQVQVAGKAHHMRVTDFLRHVRDQKSPLNELCAKYAHAFLVMTSQTAACNRLHPINERLCRWLKLVHNRLNRDEFQIAAGVRCSNVRCAPANGLDRRKHAATGRANNV